jgi:hypothetical protein
MHIEFVVEDGSGKAMLQTLLPTLIPADNVTWRVHGYRGIGKIPSNLAGRGDPSKRILRDQLPRLLAGFEKTPYVDAVVVVVDTDRRDCRAFLEELNNLAGRVAGRTRVMFRLAIEEMEAWFLGDETAVFAAYPNMNRALFRAYLQDTVCGTWEKLADAITPGGAARVNAQGWPAAGVLKAEWALQITPHMDVERNLSPSFAKFRDGVRRLVANAA